jgi:CO/xanthine dehydrogenase FAD-binding subunit
MNSFSYTRTESVNAAVREAVADGTKFIAGGTTCSI